MNYAALPPEITSTRMYTGPGSAPMRAAAAAWGGLSTELQSAADDYESVLAALTGQSWLGSASAAMSAAATRYVGWLAATAAQTAQTAAQANAAAAAYEAAFAMTVPPSVVAANRAQLMALVASNILGQNTAAIAAIEAFYGEMWAQDAAAMYGYAAASAPAADLTPFTSPQQTTSPAGQTGQAAQQAGNTAGSGTQVALSQLSPPVAQANPAAALPAQLAPAAPGELPDLVGLDVVASIGLGMAAAAWAEAHANGEHLVDLDDRLLFGQYEILNAIDAWRAPAGLSGGGLTRGPGLMSARIGEAVSAGKLSVPMTWAAAAPEIRSLSYTAPTPVAGAPLPLSAAGNAFSQMGLAGMGGSAMAGTVGRTQGEAAGQQRVRAQQAPAEPAAGDDAEPGPPLTGIAAEIREFADLRDRGLISNDEYNEQKMRLLGR